MVIKGTYAWVVETTDGMELPVIATTLEDAVRVYKATRRRQGASPNQIADVIGVRQLYTWAPLIDQARLREEQGPRMIRVWPFAAAPEELRNLSGHGGDEDWLALIPKHEDMPTWMESGTGFGRCETSEHRLASGDLVVIGAHA